MKHYVWIVGGLLMLTGCGSSIAPQEIKVFPFVIQIDEEYRSYPTKDTDAAYRLDDNESQSTLVQFALSRVDSGVSLDQMTSLNLKKLSLSLPQYKFIEQSTTAINCNGKVPVAIVSYLTSPKDSQLYHSQAYMIIQSQGYIWSVTSTSDNASATIDQLIKDARCDQY